MWPYIKHIFRIQPDHVVVKNDASVRFIRVDTPGEFRGKRLRYIADDQQIAAAKQPDRAKLRTVQLYVFHQGNWNG